MSPKPGPHIALVRLLLAIALIGVTAPRAITGIASIFSGTQSVLSDRLDPRANFGTRVEAAGRSLLPLYRSWFIRYAPAVAAAGFGVCLFRRRTPQWFRDLLEYKP